MNPTATSHSAFSVAPCVLAPAVEHTAEAPDLTDWFTLEVKPHEQDLRTWLRLRFPGLTDLDDLVAESFARMLTAKRAGKVTEARPYLFVTAGNAARDIYRRRQIVSIESIANPAGLSVVEDRTSIPEAVSRDEELSLLTDAIRALPSRCRQIVTLRKLHGLAHREIAQQLGLSENTVSAQLTLGTFRIRDYLIAHGVTRERLKSNHT